MTENKPPTKYSDENLQLLFENFKKIWAKRNNFDAKTTDSLLNVLQIDLKLFRKDSREFISRLRDLETVIYIYKGDKNEQR
jgi:chemotaxis receptor (MCP) glutamine deamidase CheD